MCDNCPSEEVWLTNRQISLCQDCVEAECDLARELELQQKQDAAADARLQRLKDERFDDGRH